MAIAVAQVGGNVTTTGGGASISFTFGSSTTTGSAVGIIGHTYNTSGAAAAGDFTDNKSNTFQLAGSSLGGANAAGIEGGYNNAGTRGASHQCTFNAPGAGESNNIAGIEITGQDSSTSTSCLDAASFATANDTASPWDVTAAAAVPSGAIGVYGVTIDTGTNVAFTDPGGYTTIISQGNGATSLVSHAAYKLSETGTPTIGATSTHTAGAGGARELFMAFVVAAGAAVVAEASFLFMPGRFEDVLPSEIRPGEVTGSIVWFQAATNQLFAQELDADQIQTPSMIRSVGHIMPTVTQTQTPTIVRQVGHIVPTVTQTQTPTIIKSVGKILTATQTQTASMIRSVGKILSVTATQTASMIRSVGKILSVTQTQTITTIRSVGKTVTVTQTQTASMIRSVGKILSVTQTQTPSVSPVKAILVTLTVTQTQTPTVTATFQAGAAATVNSIPPMVHTLNRLAGTVHLEAAGAANAWAGTVGLEVIAALNAKAGTRGLELNGVAKSLALQLLGDPSMDVDGALASIPGGAGAFRTPTRRSRLLSTAVRHRKTVAAGAIGVGGGVAALLKGILW